jgi:hypothetical protein
VEFRLGTRKDGLKRWYRMQKGVVFVTQALDGRVLELVAAEMSVFSNQRESRNNRPLSSDSTINT